MSAKLYCTAWVGVCVPTEQVPHRTLSINLAFVCVEFMVDKASHTAAAAATADSSAINYKLRNMLMNRNGEVFTRRVLFARENSSYFGRCRLRRGVWKGGEVGAVTTE